MTPRESDPTGAFSGGGGAGLDAEAQREGRVDPARPRDASESASPGVDEAERDIVTSGIAQTSEVADRDAQEDAESHGDGVALAE
jgi:hypothetical protein